MPSIKDFFTSKLRGQSAMEFAGVARRTHRAQSAMEFLMTYGWALVIMAVVIGVLFYYGVLNPYASTPNAANFPAGFTAYDYRITDDALLYLDLGHSTSSGVIITGIACSQEENPTPTSVNVFIAPSDHAVVSAETVQCLDSQGSVFTGQHYDGKVFIWYEESDTGITHRVVGRIVYTPEGGVFKIPTPTPTLPPGVPTPTLTPTVTPTATPAPPTPTPILINDCMDITEPGNYMVLASTIYPSYSGYCFDISADNVVLDCSQAGTVLRCDGGPSVGMDYSDHIKNPFITPIRVTGSNVTVIDCTVESYLSQDGLSGCLFDHAIEVSSSGVSLVGNSVVGGTFEESFLIGGTGHNISQNTIDADTGVLNLEGTPAPEAPCIYLDSSSDTVLQGNSLTGCNRGIYSDGSAEGISMLGNTITSSESDLYCSGNSPYRDGNNCDGALSSCAGSCGEGCTYLTCNNADAIPLSPWCDGEVRLHDFESRQIAPWYAYYEDCHYCMGDTGVATVVCPLLDGHFEDVANVHSGYCSLQVSVECGDEEHLETPQFVVTPEASTLNLFYKSTFSSQYSYYVGLESRVCVVGGSCETWDETSVFSGDCGDCLGETCIFKGKLADWTLYSRDLSDYIGENIYLEFRVMALGGSSIKTMYLDDIVLCPGEVGPTPTPSQQTPTPTPTVTPTPTPSAGIYLCKEITESGSYLVHTGLSFSYGNCITISAPDVTLDCQGNSIIGDGAIGILSQAEGSVIKNCNIKNTEYQLSYGIKCESGNCTLSQNTVNFTGYSLGIPVWVTGSNSYISGNTLYSKRPLRLESVTDTIVSGNDITNVDGSHGIIVNSTSEGVQLLGNTIRSNTSYYDIYCANGARAYRQDNVCESASNKCLDCGFGCTSDRCNNYAPATPTPVSSCGVYSGAEDNVLYELTDDLMNEEFNGVCLHFDSGSAQQITVEGNGHTIGTNAPGAVGIYVDMNSGEGIELKNMAVAGRFDAGGGSEEFQTGIKVRSWYRYVDFDNVTILGEPMFSDVYCTREAYLTTSSPVCSSCCGCNNAWCGDCTSSCAPTPTPVYTPTPTPTVTPVPTCAAYGTFNLAGTGGVVYHPEPPEYSPAPPRISVSIMTALDNYNSPGNQLGHLDDGETYVDENTAEGYLVLRMCNNPADYMQAYGQSSVELNFQDGSSITACLPAYAINYDASESECRPFYVGDDGTTYRAIDHNSIPESEPLDIAQCDGLAGYDWQVLREGGCSVYPTPTVTPTPACGDGTCEAGIGEDTATCPQDCCSQAQPCVNPLTSSCDSNCDEWYGCNGGVSEYCSGYSLPPGFTTCGDNEGCYYHLTCCSQLVMCSSGIGTCDAGTGCSGAYCGDGTCDYDLVDDPVNYVCSENHENCGVDCCGTGANACVDLETGTCTSECQGENDCDGDEWRGGCEGQPAGYKYCNGYYELVTCGNTIEDCMQYGTDWRCDQVLLECVEIS